VDGYVHLLEALVTGEEGALHGEPMLSLEQVAFRPTRVSRPIVAFSGGVGELIYRQARREPLPSTTFYGDLGIDLARGIVRSPVLSTHLTSHVPAALGRATLHGLAVHHTELSGATIHLPSADVLPLPDLPIVGSISPQASDEAIRAALGLAARTAAGAALRVEIEDASLAVVKPIGLRIAKALSENRFPADRPLVLLIAQNVGKTLGLYATDWGRRPYRLIVLDEVPARGAQFVGIGRIAEGVVPLAFYGLERSMPTS
jgi:ethanolamine utilization protein EutA